MTSSPIVSSHSILVTSFPIDSIRSDPRISKMCAGIAFACNARSSASPTSSLRLAPPMLGDGGAVEGPRGSFQEVITESRSGEPAMKSMVAGSIVPFPTHARSFSDSPPAVAVVDDGRRLLRGLIVGPRPSPRIGCTAIHPRHCSLWCRLGSGDNGAPFSSPIMSLSSASLALARKIRQTRGNDLMAILVWKSDAAVSLGSVAVAAARLHARAQYLDKYPRCAASARRSIQSRSAPFTVTGHFPLL